MSVIQAVTPPSLQAIEANHRRLASMVVETPVWAWRDPFARQTFPDTPISLKLELFQHAGSFKPRGALTNMLALSPQERARGVTAVSAGNHAIGVAYAASVLGLSAKVVMHRQASPLRVAMCREYGAEVVLAEDIPDAFVTVRRIHEEEGRPLIHPFEGPNAVLGTAGVGFEFMHQAPDLDAVIVAIGGGGLVAGVAAAVKAMSRRIRVFGVEPEGAKGMSDSLAAGAPMEKVAVSSIADSMSAPMHTPYTFQVVRDLVDEVVLVSDDAMRRAMKVSFERLKLVTEPAGAAALAALDGPLRERLRGAHVGLVVCGGNIDAATFYRHIEAA